MASYFSRKLIVIGIITLIGAGLLLWYFLGVAQRVPPNIIVLLVDTLRADHLGAYGYERDTSPNIDKLAQNSIQFQRAIAAAPWTAPAVSSILTGLYPSQHTNNPVRDRGLALKQGARLPQSLLTISERLKAKHYRTAAISSNPWISREFGLDQGFDNFYYFDRAGAEKIVRSAKKVITSFNNNPTQPFFLYLHFMDPHSPYVPNAKYADFFKGRIKSFTYNDEKQKNINLYDAEILYTDDQIGKFLKFLEAQSFYEDLVLVFIADHGEAFNEHLTSGHGYQLFMEEVHIPLIVKIPGHKGSVEETVSQVDIVPTLLDLVGEKPDTSLLGISLLRTDLIKKRVGIFSEVQRVFQQQAFSTTGGERLIKDFGNRKSPFLTSSFGVFDLKNDKYEQKLIDDPEIFAELSGYLQTMIQSSESNLAKDEFEVSDQTMKKLESLGYIND